MNLLNYSKDLFRLAGSLFMSEIHIDDFFPMRIELNLLTTTISIFLNLFVLYMTIFERRDRRLRSSMHAADTVVSSLSLNSEVKLDKMNLRKIPQKSHTFYNNNLYNFT